MDAIGRYLPDLDGALVGPTPLKADLLAEASDGLRNTAEAHARSGIDPLVATRRTVQGFGEVEHLASESAAVTTRTLRPASQHHAVRYLQFRLCDSEINGRTIRQRRELIHARTSAGRSNLNAGRIRCGGSGRHHGRSRFWSEFPARGRRVTGRGAPDCPLSQRRPVARRISGCTGRRAESRR
jgi:hypothetical protein